MSGLDISLILMNSFHFYVPLYSLFLVSPSFSVVVIKEEFKSNWQIFLLDRSICVYLVFAALIAPKSYVVTVML